MHASKITLGAAHGTLADRFRWPACYRLNSQENSTRVRWAAPRLCTCCKLAMLEMLIHTIHINQRNIMAILTLSLNLVTTINFGEFAYLKGQDDD
jgi:hypothetical protein